MFAHVIHRATQKIELHTCGYAHVPSVWSVHANPTRAGRVCTPFAARLQLTRNPKIRNPNPNPAVRTESAEYGHAFSYSSRFQTRTACILVLCIVHHRTLVGSGHHSNTCGQVDWQRCWACAHSVDLYCLWAVGGATPLRPLTLVLCAQH